MEPSADADRPRSATGAVARAAARPAAWLLLAVLLLQASWLLAVPPFRGSDEFDHAYRAAGVFGGHWRLDTSEPGSRGLLTRVPASLVEAASQQCAALGYTGPANCAAVPGSRRADGTVEVATGAGSYNPLLYWVLGAAGAPFSGAGSLYAMRVVCVLLCDALLAVAVTSFAARAEGRRRSGRGAGRWWYVGIATALTPTFVYSTVVAAPNGIEMAAGLAVWGTALAALSGDLTERSERRALLGLAVAAAALGFLRALGPLWLFLSLAGVVTFAGPDAVRRLWARRRRGVLVAAGGAVVGLVVAGVWTLIVGQVDPIVSSTGTEHVAWGVIVSLVPGWMLQIIDATPLRNQAGPAFVYPVVLLVVGALVVVGLVRGRARERVVVLGVVALAIAVPLAVTAATVTRNGLAWQGRYAFPFVVGLPVICGLVLDGHRRSRPDRGTAARAPAASDADRAQGWAAAIVVVALGVVASSAVLTVLHRETMRAVSTQGDGWLRPPGWAEVLLGVAATLVLLFPVVVPLLAGSPGGGRPGGQSSPSENADSRSSRE